MGLVSEKKKVRAPKAVFYILIERNSNNKNIWRKKNNVIKSEAVQIIPSSILANSR